MGCISRVAKYVIFTFNFILAVCALILIVFGVIYVVEESNGVNVFGSWFSLGGLSVIVGITIFFIASFGCCGAINESTCLLTTYAIILIILFSVQVTLGVLGIIKVIDEDDFTSYVTDLVQDLFDNSGADSIKSFHTLQVHFKCCGVKGYEDYKTGIDGYPKSCCEDEITPCFYPFEEGCASTFADAIKDNIVIIAYVALGFAVVELLGAIFAFMVRTNRDESYV